MEPGYAQVAPDEEEADLENGQEDGGEPISRRHAPAVLGVVNSSGGEGVDEEELGPPGDAGVGVEDSADGQYAEGVAEGRRWCKFCKVLQPLRSKHCLDCRMCCAKYDHHCFWLGTCVGERNHGKFWLYLLFQSLEIILALIVAQSAFRRNDPFDRTWATWWHNNSVVLPINFFLVCFAWFPTGLLVRAPRHHAHHRQKKRPSDRLALPTLTGIPQHSGAHEPDHMGGLPCWQHHLPQRRTTGEPPFRPGATPESRAILRAAAGPPAPLEGLTAACRETGHMVRQLRPIWLHAHLISRQLAFDSTHVGGAPGFP